MGKLMIHLQKQLKEVLDEKIKKEITKKIINDFKKNKNNTMKALSEKYNVNYGFVNRVLNHYLNNLKKYKNFILLLG